MAHQNLLSTSIILLTRAVSSKINSQSTATQLLLHLRQQHPMNSSQPTRQLQTTSCRKSLEEFFDTPKNFGEATVRSGRAWRVEELRLKSNTDLHKLWFVLYKERNMLYTMKEACEEESELFPSPERIDKVEESMANLENVVRERNKAYWQLEVSPCATAERPTVFRRDVFGRPRWHQCSQHIAPYHKNWHFRNSQGPGKTNETDWFFQRYREMRRKHYNYTRSKTARHLRDIFRRFPDADADYISEIHPEFPPGYVQHLKKNWVQYNDPPANCIGASVAMAKRNLEKNRETQLIE